MASDQDKILKYFVAVEKLGGEILSDKQAIIILDKSRNRNREALRALSCSVQKTLWMNVAGVFVKKNLEEAKAMLEDEQKKLDIEINKIRSELKVKVNNLRDLEMLPPVRGLNLKPLSKHEAMGLANAGLFPQ